MQARLERLGEPRRRPRRPLQPGGVEVGFVDAGDLHGGAEVAQDGAEGARELAVVGEIAAQEDGVRAAPAGLGQRHRRADAVGARLVGRRRDDAPSLRLAPDDHRPAAQLGAAAHLGIGEEGVEIDVDHPPLRHRPPPREPRH